MVETLRLQEACMTPNGLQKEPRGAAQTPLLLCSWFKTKRQEMVDKLGHVHGILDTCFCMISTSRNIQKCQRTKRSKESHTATLGLLSLFFPGQTMAQGSLCFIQHGLWWLVIGVMAMRDGNGAFVCAFVCAEMCMRWPLVRVGGAEMVGRRRVWKEEVCILSCLLRVSFIFFRLSEKHQQILCSPSFAPELIYAFFTLLPRSLLFW